MGIKGFEGLLPAGTIDVREVCYAEVVPSRRNLPLVRCAFEEGGIIHLAPLDYMNAALQCKAVDPNLRSHYDPQNIWSIWRHLPGNTSFLIGRSISFVVEHVQLQQNGVTYQTFRFKEVVG